MPKDFLIFRVILFTLLLLVESHALNIGKKYSAYPYVFNEFDVPQSYIYNDAFISFVSRNQRSMRKFYKRSLKRGKSLLPTMKGILVGEGVSDLFLYLSIVESGLSNTATSSKKAVGLWQFMPATARQYNLQVCKNNDERCNPVTATSAAIQYLNKLHREFGKWYLAAMAYNCGEGCVERAIHKAGTDDIATLTDNKLKILPKETRDYIRKILLVAMIGESKHGIKVAKSSKQSSYVGDELIEVEVPAGTSLRRLAKMIKLEYKVLQKLNRRMKDGKVPSFRPTYLIKIPLEKVYAFYLRYEMLEEDRPKKSHLISHSVKIGDTLESIALTYRANVAEIMQANHLMDTYLEVGQFLVIPVTKNVFENAIPQ